MGLKVISAWILIKPDAERNKSVTATGIYVGNELDKPTQIYGTVMDLGLGVILPNGFRTQFTVKKGDRVIIKSYAGDEVILNEEKYLVILESDILLYESCKSGLSDPKSKNKKKQKVRSMAKNNSKKR